MANWAAIQMKTEWRKMKMTFKVTFYVHFINTLGVNAWESENVYFPSEVCFLEGFANVTEKL